MKRNNILWASFYIAVALAWVGVLAVDSLSLFPALLACCSLAYVALFVSVNPEAFYD